MGKITIVGTGWTEGQLTLQAAEIMTGEARIILHTDQCGCALWLASKGIPYDSLDDLYDASTDFDEHTRAAARAVLEAAEKKDVVYGVFDVRDRTVHRILEEAGDRVQIIAGPPAEGPLLALCTGQTRTLAAAEWEDCQLSAHEDCLIRELDSRELAAEIKLRLMEIYPEEEQIWLLNSLAEPVPLALYELDRAEHYDHRTSALIPAQRTLTSLERYDFEHLTQIMRLLCGPNGCPWDRVQTHESLRPYILEEAYEVIDAIDEADSGHLYDELGDVLMQVSIHAEIARRHGEFDISDVTTAICEKLIARHTHIFGRDNADDPEQVVGLWNRNKMAERGQTTYTQVLRSVTRTLPALLRGVKVLRRCGDVGLKEEDRQEGVQRVLDHVAQIAEADGAEEKMGDALLELADLARMMDVDPEIALNRSIDRMIDRFEALERQLREDHQRWEELDSATLKEYWDSVKL